VKIHAATVKALKKKERQGETQFTAKTEVPHPWMLIFFLRGRFCFFWIFHPIYDHIQRSSVVFLYYIPLMTIPSCKVILINCGYIFWWSFFFAVGHLVDLSLKKTLWSLPSSSKNHIFTFFYIYLILHIHLECKSQTIYMHNTGFYIGRILIGLVSFCIPSHFLLTMVF